MCQEEIDLAHPQFFPIWAWVRGAGARAARAGSIGWDMGWIAEWVYDPS